MMALALKDVEKLVNQIDLDGNGNGNGGRLHGREECGLPKEALRGL